MGLARRASMERSRVTGGTPRAYARAMRTVLLALAIAPTILLAGCGDPEGNSSETGRARPASPEPTFQTVEVDDVAEEVEAGEVLLVDVRTDEEWQAGRAARAMHVPLDEVEERLDEIDRAAGDRPVAFICRSGRRSAEAAGIAVGAGIEEVVNVDGGMQAWVDEGLPLDPAGGTVA